MTIREYVSQKLQAFNVTEAIMADVMSSLGTSINEEYTFDVAASVGKALALSIEEIILAPRLTNVSESGFSMSWDYSDLGKYYKYLCNKWGVPVNEDVLSSAGLSVITDKTNLW